jgi:hypothetical protein
MLKHLVLSVVSFLHHQYQPLAKPKLIVAKPALDIELLNRTSEQLVLLDTDKLVCVYPVSAKK